MKKENVNTTDPKLMKKVNSSILAAALLICFIFPATGYSTSADFLWLGNRQQTKTNAPTQTETGNAQTPPGLTVAADVLATILSAMLQSNVGNYGMPAVDIPIACCKPS